MVSVRHFLVLAVPALAGCVQPLPPDAHSPWPAETHTVLSGEAATRLSRQCSRASPGPIDGVWMPTDAQITELEIALRSLLAQRLEAAGLRSSPNDYYRQYAGFVIGGRPIIYVNGLDYTLISEERDARRAIRTPGYSWRTHSVDICDGGPITFGVEYDTTTRTFANFAFNGTVGGPFPPNN